ncbi:hemolysin family protein [Patescibacteria group bacterium]
MVESILILLILILFSGFFSGAEVALVSVSSIKVKTFLKEKRKGSGALMKLKARPRRMIITILIGNNIVNIAAASMATLFAADRFGSTGIGVITGLLTLLILIFGEITPKTLAQKNAGTIALIIAKPISILGTILFPLVYFLEWLSKKLEGVVKLKRIASISEAEIRATLEYGVEKNVIDQEERNIMARAIRFSDITIREIMTPINKVFSLDCSQTINQTLNQIIESGFSRIPIYKGKKDNISNIILIRDVMREFKNIHGDKTLEEIANQSVYVDDTIELNHVMKMFQDKQIHMAFVKDKKNKVIGVVTLEDIIEELVGEITDESDLKPNTIIRVDKNTIVTHGDSLIERINKFFNVDLPVQKVNLQGLIRQHLEKIEKNVKWEIADVLMIIEDIRDSEIIKVRLIKKNNHN